MAFEWLKDMRKRQRESKKMMAGASTRMRAPERTLRGEYSSAGGSSSPMNTKKMIYDMGRYDLGNVRYTGNGRDGKAQSEYSSAGGSSSPMNTKKMIYDMGGYDLGNVRYTGNGPDGKAQPWMPTAVNNYVEHEGETVVKADLTRDLGGPENIDNILKQLRMAVIERKGGLQGYQQGGTPTPPTDVNSQSIKDTEDNLSDKDVSAAGFDVNSQSVEDTTGADVDMDAVKDTAKDLTGKDLSAADIAQPETQEANQYGQQFRTSLGMLEEQAKGESPELDKVQDYSRQRLSGQQAQAEAAKRGEIAQTMKGAPGGAAAAAMAMQKAGAREQTMDLEAELSKQKIDSIQSATRDLADASMKGMSFEENKRQFGEHMAMQIEKFNENKRQFGLQTAIALDQHNFNRNMDVAQQAMNAGDFSGAAEIFNNKLGMNIDMSVLQDEQNRNILKNGMSDIQASIEQGFDADNPVVQTQLQSIWESTATPNEDGSIPPMNEDWAKKTYDKLKLKMHPIRGPLEALDDRDYELMAASSLGAGDPDFDLENYVYPGTGNKGLDGFKDAITALALGGGMKHVNGSYVPDMESDAFKAMFGGTPKGRIEQLENTAEFKAADVGDRVYDDQGNPYTVGKDAEGNKTATPADPDPNIDKIATNPLFKDAVAGDLVRVGGREYFKTKGGQPIEVHQNFGSTATKGSMNVPSIYDGTDWRELTEGETFTTETSIVNEQKARGEDMGWPNGVLPRGTYTVETLDNGLMVYKNALTGDRYLAESETSKIDALRADFQGEEMVKGMGRIVKNSHFLKQMRKKYGLK